MSKIDDVKDQLRGEVEDKDGVKKLAYFDVKDGAEDGDAYHKVYLEETKKAMGDLFQKTEWGDLSAWEKLCCYKISASKGKGVDCDASLRSTVIYQLAFEDGKGTPYPYKPGMYLLERDGLILRGDTMNSYATTVREYIREIWLPEHMEEMQAKKIIVPGRNSSWEVAQVYQDISKNNYWDAAILNEYDYFKDILPEAAQEFFRLYHTVGNFLPAPQAFQDRGSARLPSRDYWDLALMCIYNDRCEPRHEKYTLEWLIKKEEAVSSCRVWLDSFGTGQKGWNNFVERNFLQDFVNQATNQTKGRYGLPKELWDGHFTGKVMPSEKTHFEQFFANASAWIAARGLRVALAVKKALA